MIMEPSMNGSARERSPDKGHSAGARHPSRARLIGLKLCAAAALAVALCECSDGGRVKLPGAIPKDKCPISRALLGGVWGLDFGTGGPGSVLAGCADDSLNGRPVYVSGGYLCMSILPCPTIISFNTRVVLDLDFDRGLIVVQGEGASPGDILSAEIRTPDCLVRFEFRQAGVNDPLAMNIHCGGDFDERSGTMSADCQAVVVNDNGRYIDCSIDPPFLPTVTLRTDSGV